MLNADGKKVGEYLLRFSNSERGGFSLSIITAKDTVQHLRILRTDGVLKVKITFKHLGLTSFEGGKSEYKTWDELLKACKTPYNLKKPCRIPTPFETVLEAWNQKLNSWGYVSS